MRVQRLLLFLSVQCAALAPALGQSPDITLHSTVSGNREQPKVMYLLPWRQPSDSDIEQEFSAGLEGDLFVALDRDEFLRELSYRATMNTASNVGRDKSLETLLTTE